MKGLWFLERFKELESTEKFVLIITFIIFIYVSIMVAYELIDTYKMQRGYIVDTSFLKMKERCCEELNNRDIKITVTNHYVTNYICDI